MKKSLFLFFLLVVPFLFMACPSDQGTLPTEPGIDNNLSSSRGDNELKGNTYSSTNEDYTFEENSVTKSSKPSDSIYNLSSRAVGGG